MRRKRRYTDEFKQEVLAMAASGEKSIPQLAQDLGINANVIYRWRQRYRVDEATEQLLPSHERELESENRRLRRELAIAKQERDVLKKAIQIFSQLGYEVVAVSGRPASSMCACTRVKPAASGNGSRRRTWTISNPGCATTPAEY